MLESGAGTLPAFNLFALSSWNNNNIHNILAWLVIICVILLLLLLLLVILLVIQELDGAPIISSSHLLLALIN